mmetsp:Transcript_16536/g.27428  ORF Transcript_16536/g.27428 Transcript_16536/m.27428 type:complete len:221 (+) Transcript_16536:169-831(+)|eukprot:CAMPEP_0119013830 /NCGR_PEP_ID=MMETSP1176-20130426/9065_1 /TAXON_ID=265551 /ORGANISM="Synedropsis recta cf, Strain CCMP1620" /LENGTH=220 /DNA_ID=CAMNT_0006966949 /DNA_START=148 /DNA_END=810 /DNA_ORIENTATION=+
MDVKMNQLRNELLVVRNQREAANAVHLDRTTRHQERLDFLQIEVNRVEKKGVLPHEAKGALERAYHSTGGSAVAAHRRPLQYVARRQAVLLATMMHVHLLENAKGASRSMGDTIHRSMICEITTIEHERMKLWVDFHHQRNALLVEKKAMAIRYDQFIQHQRMILNILDPSRMDTPKKAGFFKHLGFAPTSPMSKILNGASPMKIFKSTSNMFQIVPRTA